MYFRHPFVSSLLQIAEVLFCFNSATEMPSIFALGPVCSVCLGMVGWILDIVRNVCPELFADLAMPTDFLEEYF